MLCVQLGALTFTFTGSQWEVIISSLAGTTGIQRGKQLTLGHTGFAESGLFALQGLVGLEEKSEAVHLSGL